MISPETLHTLKKQLSLLDKEKAADYEFFKERMMLTSPYERDKKGTTWFPVRLTDDFISTGERITLVIEKKKHLERKHAFQVGSIVSVFAESDERDKNISGVVGYLKDETMRVVLNKSYVPDWAYEDSIGVNLMFDDSTYREMSDAINRVILAKNNRLSELRDAMYGEQKAPFDPGHHFNVESLNDVQNEAFHKICDARLVAFVHGPPGTGKTTTLTKSITEVVRQEKQVLVCAPSNAAVDLIVEKLVNEDLNVLRLGHPARLTPEVVENSLDVKISKHKDFGRLKEMRIQSEEYRTLASRYKRKFGKTEKFQRDLLFKESKALRRESRDLENYISESLLDNAQVIACTLTGSANKLIRDRLFKTVFIDETSQALEAATWIPLDRVRRVIMSGDHFQLPPTIKSFEAGKEGLEDTLFAKGVRNQPDATTMLEIQYRMETAIMGFSSMHFYDGKLKVAEEIKRREKKFDHPLEFVDTAGSGHEESVKQETLSTYNRQEAELLINLLAAEKLTNLSVGIITPYKAQVEIISELLNDSDALAPYRSQIQVNTVDAFQGQERDVIYISLVRANDRGEIGFLKEYRRLNVAMTRARYRLVLIGDSATLGSDHFFNELLDYVQRMGKYSSIFEFIDP